MQGMIPSATKKCLLAMCQTRIGHRQIRCSFNQNYSQNQLTICTNLLDKVSNRDPNTLLFLATNTETDDIEGFYFLVKGSSSTYSIYVCIYSDQPSSLKTKYQQEVFTKIIEHVDTLCANRNITVQGYLHSAIDSDMLHILQELNIQMVPGIPPQDDLLQDPVPTDGIDESLYLKATISKQSKPIWSLDN